jgi:DNA-directed RNA polymerase sigma subunit (sigma70/sigma32)
VPVPLALDVSAATGSIHLNAGARGSRTLRRGERHDVDTWLERAADAVLDMPATCALDVADRGGVTLAEIADLLGITRERARQIDSTALAKLRVAADKGDDGDQAE